MYELGQPDEPLTPEHDRDVMPAWGPGLLVVLGLILWMRWSYAL